MKYYKDNINNVFAYELDGSQNHLIGDKVAMTAQEVEAHINPPKTQDQIIAHFKEIYLSVVDAKLKDLDYDSLATVKLWEDDATFGAEATRILNWYKAIIHSNYTILTDVSNLVHPMPTDIEYLRQINAIIY